jgi:hypothetical protein
MAPAQRHLPQPLVVHADPGFLAALAPDEQDLRELIVAQSMELLSKFREVIGPAVEIADHAFLQRLQQHFAFSFDVDTLPAPFPAPALFLTGRQDPWCGYQDAYQLLDNYPRASFVVLDRAGHALSVEQKTLFRALVHEWLDRVEEYTLNYLTIGHLLFAVPVTGYTLIALQLEEHDLIRQLGIPISLIFNPKCRSHIAPVQDARLRTGRRQTC